jgi:hypothetical protein
MSNAQLYALIDANTNRVYAVKALLSNRWCAYVCYIAMGLYGEPCVLSKTVENKPSVETSTIPGMLYFALIVSDPFILTYYVDRIFFFSFLVLIFRS